MLNVNDISNALDVNPETVRRWIRSGKLKAQQNSKKEGNVITMEAFKDFLNDIPKYAERNSRTYAESHMKQANDFTNRYTIEFNDRSYMWDEHSPLANRHFVDICLHSLINKHIRRGAEWKCGATFINELLDDLHLPRTKRGQVEGWKIKPDMTYEKFERYFDVRVIYLYSDDVKTSDQICAIDIDMWTDGNVMDELMD
ncbi:MAG: helix-turn-helix domain-containing protein [Clostridiales bacterium]|nr:helix-turn-helix domain-containing protein [Clostridiales bacterium]